ncbi:MAG TPA: hypothetical protein VH255_03385 [Verrucomicrobiae bacterium]|nr:hypothetical protein [Verrucomicrobiae bacterium]
MDNGDKYPMDVSIKNGGTMEGVTNGLAYLHFQVMSNELSAPKVLVCPTDKSRVAARSFNPGEFGNTNISYFVGVDASDAYPQMMLLGDRNLSLNDVPVRSGLISLTTNTVVGWTDELHVRKGNIGLADGSVQQSISVKLQGILQTAVIGTNRLVAP